MATFLPGRLQFSAMGMDDTSESGNYYPAGQSIPVEPITWAGSTPNLPDHPFQVRTQIEAKWAYYNSTLKCKVTADKGDIHCEFLVVMDPAYLQNLPTGPGGSNEQWWVGLMNLTGTFAGNNVAGTWTVKCEIWNNQMTQKIDEIQLGLTEVVP